MKAFDTLRPTRRDLFRAGAFAGLAALTLPLAGGCISPAVTASLPEPAEIAELGAEAKLVGEIANTTGLEYIKVEAVALVTGLGSTGSDPPPSPQRAMLTADMQTRGVQGINDILASPSTSLVLCRAYLPPGVRKGDRLDVEVLVPARSETTSLRGGWLMPCRLEETAVLGGDVHRGRVLAHAQGPVLVDSIVLGSDDPTHAVHGRVPGGVVSVHERNLGLVLHSDYQSVVAASRVGIAINTRFFVTDRRGKRGAATPKRDNYIELTIHPRYRHNLARYVHVIRSIAIKETDGERAERLMTLEKQLANPTTSALAAVRLEAIGNDAVESLARALPSTDPEVRFYAAEALAYLGDRRAIAPLAEYARSRPAFRWHALTALSAMDTAEDMSAYEALNELLHVPSAETRYGAFRALWAMNPGDPLVRGEMMGQEFSYHVLETTGEPMVHFSRTRRPELVVFGGRQQLRCPFLFAGKIMVKAGEDGRVRMTRFAPGKPDLQEECGPSLDEIIRCLVRMEANYGDVFEFLHEMKQKDVLPGRLVVDALPLPGRRFNRTNAEEGASTAASQEEGPVASSPKPSLFFTPGEETIDARSRRVEPIPSDEERESAAADEGDETEEKAVESAESPKPEPGILDRIFPWARSS